MLAVSWSLTLSLISALVAAFTDLRTRTIPNWLTFPLSAIGLVGHGFFFGTGGVVEASLGCVLCFLPAFFLFARGALGGGDVKLFAGFGALLGAREGLELELLAFMLIALFALWNSAWNGRLWKLLTASLAASLHLVWPSRFVAPSTTDGTSEMPMGGAILLAALTLCARSWWS
jgi:prepilin peptidase CpaA